MMVRLNRFLKRIQIKISATVIRPEIINNIITYSFGAASKLRKAILIKVSEIKN